MTYPGELSPLLVHNIPEIGIWCAGVIIGIILISRNPSATTRLFLIGCICLFIAELAQPFLQALVLTNFVPASYSSASRFGTMMMLVRGLPVSIVSLAGYILLVLAFWYRFRKNRAERGV